MTQTSKPTAAPVTDVRTAERMVTEISALAGGGEHYQATFLEADLWEGVLEAVAGGHAQAAYLATAALKSKEIDFPRQKIA
ncbi:hypothetical protein [Longimicrobium sp.]|jgi:hypothetical protein|uniref:hypothetical protein n=1 Tax=Longimicrobium sp. TaxID=2029185 RepID=UPI002ED7A321